MQSQMKGRPCLIVEIDRPSLTLKYVDESSIDYFEWS